MYSTTTRLTGLSSGMDTEAMISQLMKAESMKMNKLKQNRQLLTWKQQSYRNVAKTMQTFQNTFTSLSGANMSTSLRLASNFKTLKSTVKTSDGKDSSAVKTRVTDASATTNFSIDVVSTAKKDTYTSQTIDMKYTSEYSLFVGSAISGALQSGDSFTVSLDGAASVTINLSGEDVTGTDAQIIKKINDKLLSRFGYDTGPDGKPTTNQKVSIKMGADERISFVASAGHTVTVGTGSSGRDALIKMGFEQGGTTSFDTKMTLSAFGAFDGLGKDSIQFTINDVAFNFDKTDTLEKVMNDINKSSAGVTFTFDSFRSAFKLEANTTGSGSKIKFNDPDGFFAHSLGMADSYTGKAQAFKLATRIEDTQYYNNLANSPQTISFKINGKNFQFDKSTEIRNILIQVNNSDAGVNMTYDADSGKFSVNSKSGATGNITLEDTSGLLKGFMGITLGDPQITFSGVAKEPGIDLSGSPTVLSDTSYYQSLSGAPANIKLTINSHDFTFDKDMTIKDILVEINGAGMGVTIDYADEKFTVSSDGYFEIDDTDGFMVNFMGVTGANQQFLYEAPSFTTGTSVTGFTMDSTRLGDTSYFRDKYGLEDGQEYDDDGLTGVPKDINFTINGVDFKFSTGAEVGFMIDSINNSGAGVNVTYDEKSGSFAMTAKPGATNNSININDTDGFIKGFMGIDSEQPANTAHTQAAADAVFKYNGVYVTRESNTFELEGVEITLTDAAKGAFDIDVARDTTQAFEMLVKFADEYNKMIDTLNSQVSTTRPTSGKYTKYDPLTDDQKAAMTEKEIEQWEAKAQEGMLYRDDILTSLMSQLRSMIYTPVTRDDGSKIGLFDIGITTSSKDKYVGKLEIDETVLRNALENNADAISDLFTKQSSKPGAKPEDRKARLTDEGLGDRLNDIIRNAIDVGGTIYSRSGVENSGSVKSNEIQFQLEKQDEKISDMLNYLVRRENYYYTMFSNMENAMNKANNQMSQLLSTFSS